MTRLETPHTAPDPGLLICDALTEHLAPLAGPGRPFRRVIGLLDAAAETTLKPPVLAVVPAAFSAGPNRTGRAGALQEVTLTIATTILIAAPDDPRGRKTRSRGRLAELLGPVRRRLLGWCPDPCAGVPGRPAPLALVSGRLLEIEAGRVVWQDEWAAKYWIHAQPPEDTL